METEPRASKRIQVVTKVLAANDRIAQENRERCREAGVFVVDVMGGPGAGKTALLKNTLVRVADRLRTAVITGDIATTRDAERLSGHGAEVIQITTESFGGACHLEASTIRQALVELDLDAIDLLFVENVGNLVCPAEFDIGQNIRTVVLSVAEGEDKPLKYPLAFRTADIAVITKTDLLPHLELSIQELKRNISRINAGLECFEVSNTTAEGIDQWTAEILRRSQQALAG
jgi:hydrogenase nickel incorporation protein HypB